MGGSIAPLFSRWYTLKHRDHVKLLMCGMAAGFGAVFGTPITDSRFAMEVLAIGRIKYDAMIPCLIASILADVTCSAYGIHHTRYSIAFVREIHNTKQLLPNFSFDFLLLFKVIIAGVTFGLAGYLF